MKSYDEFEAQLKTSPEATDWAAPIHPAVSTKMVVIKVDRDCPNGDVTLTNNGNAQAKAGTAIRWIITSPCIRSIEIIVGSKGHSEHRDIWAIEPVPVGRRIWEGLLKDSTEVGSAYEDGFYSLIWFDQYKTPHVIDPLIRVNR